MFRKMISLMTALVMIFALAAPAAGEAAEPAEGMNRITFYWDAEGADLEKCDMWIWFPGADGRGYLFEPCDYGAKVTMDVPEDITQVGFIVRKDCSEPGGTGWGSATKDYDGDRFAEIAGRNTEVFLKAGDGKMYLSNDHGATLYEKKEFTLAGITAMNEIQYFVTPATRIESLDQVRITADDGSPVEVTGLSSLNNNVIMGTITVAGELDLSRFYTVEIEGYGSVTALPTKVFDSEEFNSRYYYDGDDLGATWTDSGTLFKVWAPTASRVRLRLFEAGDGGDAYETLEMTRADRGVWQAEADCGAGAYYTYLVTTAAGEQEAVDPYAKAVGVNGDRGMVVNLADTEPEGFEQDTFVQNIGAYNEAVIWEVHVRDFSNKLASSRYPGKYLAFTEHGLTNASGEKAGIDYLTDLGINYVHLQPVYDFATVDESAEGGFNWGYDPKNYNAPEGSYATDPYHGEVRIREFKQMVQALHDSGLGVVMDVVYNHTYSADSCLNRIVPYYYYRYDGMGKLSNGSGCGNETASERPMMRKYIVDSVRYWAEEYHVDGFRFDLMALHDLDTMQAVEQAVHAVNPKAILYGEGWTGGTSTLVDGLRASQANIRKVTPSEGAAGGVAVFNDAIRDGLKGSVFDAKEKGYISGNVSKGNADKVIFGLTGGKKIPAVSWRVKNNEVINYMSCHDNHTLYDRLLSSNGDDSEEARLQMNRFGISIVMIGEGIPFFLAGEEMLRSKNGDSNSYNSGDEVNNIRWDDLTPGSEVMKMRDFYRELIAMRKANAFLTRGEVECAVAAENGIEAVYTLDGETAGYAFINPSDAAVEVTLPEGEWEALLYNEAFGGGKALSGTVPVDGRTVLLVKAK